MTTGRNGNGKGALEGVKVIDMTRFGAGPICTQNLGDMGAEVVKVEEPNGDPARYNAPLKGDVGGYFPAFNRNKKSVTLNLRAEKGKDLFRKLVKWADIIVENFRPGTMEKLGIGYDDLRKLNQRIILVSITGFGQTGPLAGRAAFDGVAQAVGGLMALTGFPDREPVRAGVLVGDMTGGMIGTIGALTALYHQKATGEGQRVDASMYDALLVLLSARMMTHVRGARVSRGDYSPVAPCGTFLSKDGKYFYIMGHDNNHFPHVARLAGHPDLVDKPGYKTRAERAKRTKELNDMLGAWVASKTAAEVSADLEKSGVPFGLVQDVDDVLRDPHVRATGTIVEVDHEGERLPLVGLVPKLSVTPGSIRSIAPHLGQHNEAVYCGTLGLSKSELAELKQAKVV